MTETRSGYSKEWLADHQALCYRFYDLTIQTIDGWSADLTAEFAEWPLDQSWRLLLDIRLRGSIISTYALRKARDIARMRPELPGRLSVLVASRLAADIITIAIRATNNTYRRRSVFVNEALALHWLLEENKVHLR
ncbi:MAG: hypothetical protein ABI690_24455 [Chloroflexota bacterium]